MRPHVLAPEPTSAEQSIPDHDPRNFSDTLNAIHRAAPGAPVEYFRAPGGNFTPALVGVAAVARSDLDLLGGRPT